MDRQVKKALDQQEAVVEREKKENDLVLKTLTDQQNKLSVEQAAFQAKVHEKKELAEKLKVAENPEEVDSLSKKLTKLNAELTKGPSNSVGEVNVGWKVVRRGKVYKKVQVFTIMNNSLKLQMKEFEAYLNKMNKLIRELSITEGWEELWTILELVTYYRDEGLYELG